MNTITYQTKPSQARKTGLQRLLSGDISHLFPGNDEASKLLNEIETIEADIKKHQDKLLELGRKLQTAKKLYETASSVDKKEKHDYPIKPLINKRDKDINLSNLSIDNKNASTVEVTTSAEPEPKQQQNVIEKAVDAITDAVDAATVKARIHANSALKKALSWGIYEGLLYKAARKIGIKRLSEIAFRIVKLADDYFKLAGKTIEEQRAFLFTHEMRKLGLIPQKPKASTAG